MGTGVVIPGFIVDDAKMRQLPYVPLEHRTLPKAALPDPRKSLAPHGTCLELIGTKDNRLEMEF
jgi:hypothetical protein